MGKKFFVLFFFTVLGSAFVEPAKLLAASDQAADINNILVDLEDDVSGLVKLLNESSFVGIGVSVFEAKAIFGGKNNTVFFVLETLKNSPAARAGLMENDVIVAINRKNFTSIEDFRNAITGDGKPGRKILVGWMRGEKSMNAEMTTVFFGIKPEKAAELEKEIRAKGGELIEKTLNAYKKDEKGFEEALANFNNWLINTANKIKNLKTPE